MSQWFLFFLLHNYINIHLENSDKYNDWRAKWEGPWLPPLLVFSPKLFMLTLFDVFHLRTLSAQLTSVCYNLPGKTGSKKRFLKFLRNHCLRLILLLTVNYQDEHIGFIDTRADFEENLNECFLPLRLIALKRCTVGLKQSRVPL